MTKFDKYGQILEKADSAPIIDKYGQIIDGAEKKPASHQRVKTASTTSSSGNLIGGLIILAIVVGGIIIGVASHSRSSSASTSTVTTPSSSSSSNSTASSSSNTSSSTSSDSSASDSSSSSSDSSASSSSGNGSSSTSEEDSHSSGVTVTGGPYMRIGGVNFTTILWYVDFSASGPVGHPVCPELVFYWDNGALFQYQPEHAHTDLKLSYPSTRFPNVPIQVTMQSLRLAPGYVPHLLYASTIIYDGACHDPDRREIGRSSTPAPFTASLAN